EFSPTEFSPDGFQPRRGQFSHHAAPAGPNRFAPKAYLNARVCKPFRRGLQVRRRGPKPLLVGYAGLQESCAAIVTEYTNAIVFRFAAARRASAVLRPICFLRRGGGAYGGRPARRRAGI